MAKRNHKSTVAVETPPIDSGELHRKHASLIVVQGAEIGRDFRLRSNRVTIGRGSDADVRLVDEQASRIHARILREWSPGDTVRYLISDERSTNGTYVNSKPARRSVLRDGDKIQVGSTVLKFVILDGIDVMFHAEIRDRINYDALTGLLTKESLYLALNAELERCREYGLPLSVLMMDLDRFKSVNDTHGHRMGSHVLSEVGRLIRNSIRDTDVSARYGGEEFVSYLAETDLAGAQRVAERIRTAIESHEFTLDEKTIGVSISIGIACQPQHGCEIKTLVDSADRALYAAKGAGRNRVYVA